MTTVHRLPATLEKHRFVQFDRTESKWHVGAQSFAVGEKVDAKVTSIDRSARRITLSIKALETEDKHWDWTMTANARALLALARKADDLAGWGRMISDVASGVEQDVRLRRFLEAPQVSAERKNAILAKAYEDRVPRLFLRFLQKLVDNRRQMLIPAIAPASGDRIASRARRLAGSSSMSKRVARGAVNSFMAWRILGQAGIQVFDQRGDGLVGEEGAGWSAGCATSSRTTSPPSSSPAATSIRSRCWSRTTSPIPATRWSRAPPRSSRRWG